jgi:putative intracellular protease/amidase
MKLLVSLLFICTFLITSAKTPKVLLIVRDGSTQLEYMLNKEVFTMKDLLEKSGCKVTIATISGESINAGNITLKPDTKLSLVNINDYAGFIFPCMATNDSISPAVIAFAKKVADTGKPIAAQLGSVLMLAKAGALKGKKFAFTDDKNLNVKMYPEMEEVNFSGPGVVQDGNVITSGTCPLMAKMNGTQDGTAELTQKLIAMVKPK